ncbi:BMP family ABC transporter substrate-binding protein [Cryptosporangium phraense]|uniref:BMP family ABC transporter substrate-binding protein n=1 Tax=Cryptosporangium phraense TaxID=2593070 RepID=A0A545AH58_9ACTN|nr:BMP family ABC transporter substrate-binding protein [Cryptosporangium phraense]TQS40654.1 BMP family ABC transporter substrate-binding protein [Cryptosporangium phraense]
MRRLLAIGLGAALTVMAVTGCSADSGSGSSGGGSSQIVVITPNPVGVDAFLKLSVDGSKAAAKAQNADVKVYESTDPTSISQNLQAAIDAKPKLIIAIGFNFDDLMKTAPVDNPDQQFLQVDSCPENPAKNLTCARFKEYEAVYLAGVEAGLLTKKNAIGAVAALDSPFIHRWTDPFGEGAKSVNPKTAFTPLFVGGNNPFSDPARANAQATTLGQKGVDYVMAASSAGNTGVFQAAKAGGFNAFGVDVNECGKQPGVVVDNAIKRVDVAIENAVKAIYGGKPGGVTEYGLKEDGVGLTGLEDDVASSGCLIAQHPDVLAKVKEARDQIVAGTLTIKDPAAA